MCFIQAKISETWWDSKVYSAILQLISQRRSTQSFSILLPFPAKITLGGSVSSMHSETKLYKNHRLIQFDRELSMHKTQSSVKSEQTAQGLILLGLKNLQRWSVNKLFGNLFWCLTVLVDKKNFFIPSVNLFFKFVMSISHPLTIH